MFMDNFSEPYIPEMGSANLLEKNHPVEPINEAIPDRDIDWVNKYGKEICFAGVSLRNRWGFPGQAKPGTYIQTKNGVHIYRSFEGDSNIQCVIEGAKLLMSWSSKFKDNPNRYYKFKKFGDGKSVEITEYEWGTVTSKVYRVRS